VLVRGISSPWSYHTCTPYVYLLCLACIRWGLDPYTTAPACTHVTNIGVPNP
jgi:hypothetical protein